MIYVWLLILMLILPGCDWNKQQQTCSVPEYFITDGSKQMNVDSIAVWHGPQQQHWLVATAKATHTLPVYDATTGQLIKTFGSQGKHLGAFERPNGIAIQDNILFVVERDNARLQILNLPDGQVLGATKKQMKRPYGLAVITTAPDEYMVYVTDNHGDIDIFDPKKIHQYQVRIAENAAHITYIQTFADAQGPGALQKVESIAADQNHNRLFIADEHEQQKNVKIYTLDGIFTGQTIGDGLLAYEPEGIAIYQTSGTHGYIIVTDQDKVNNQFYLFDRATLIPIKPFKGKIVRNTDGIALTNQSFGPFSTGAFYAVHNDGNICAYDWHLLAMLCGLQEKRQKST